MTAAGNQINRNVLFLPGVNSMEWTRCKVVVIRHYCGEVLAFETLHTVCGRKYKLCKIDCVESQSVGHLDAFSKGSKRCRSLPKLVSIMMDKPVGFKFHGELFFSSQKSSPIVIPWVRESLPGHPSAASELTDNFDRVVCRLVVNDVNVDTLGEEVLQRTSEVQLLVSRSEESNYPHSGGILAQGATSLTT